LLVAGGYHAVIGDEANGARRALRRFGDGMMSAAVRACVGFARPGLGHARGDGPRPRVLVLNQNNSVPSDRRVWNEITALCDGGYEVTAICPKGEACDQQSFERREGVDIHRFRQTPSSGGAPGYLREFAVAMFNIRRLVRRVARETAFDVVHACNPPDLLLFAALSQKRRGARFVFDHHDLSPELYLARFARGKDVLYRLSLLVEALNFRLADVVLATNESYKRIAIGRGGKRADDVFVVRSAPVLSGFAPVPADPALKRGRPHLLTFIGEMAPQDGLDHALRALAILRRRRDDWHAVLAGDGPALEDLRRLACELDLAENVEFPGWLLDPDLRRLLSTSDVCLVPDPRTELSDASTLVKVAEYLAMSCPVVAYDLTESRVTAGDAAVYARPSEPESFAAAIEQLLDDPDRRRRMGALGRQRIERGLAWEHSARSLLAAYEHVLNGALGRRRAQAKR
jgi:glycosyltransferase involved in cell wall biosynthesis